MKRTSGSTIRTTTAGPRLRRLSTTQTCLELICVLVVLIASVYARAQFICVPAKNCSCDEEKVFPNLRVLNSTTLRGAFTDPTGAPITFSRTIVQVRDLKSQAVLASAVLDGQGRFDLGEVPAGQFRFIAFQRQGSKIRRLPLFNQPRPVSCSDKQACRLDIVLTMHATDQPFELCPPK